MRVIYIDEAGSSHNESVFTWAAIIVKDRQWLKIERLAKDIIVELVPSELRVDFEFHAHEIFNGSEQWFPWRNKSGKELRFEILYRIVRLIQRFHLPIIECSWEKRGTRDVDLIKRRQGTAFLVCVDSVERWFVENAKNDVGMLIADDQSKPADEAIFKQEIRRARTVSRLSRKPALRHIVDTIHFAGSHESIGLQLADACAFLIKRHRVGKEHNGAEDFYRGIQPCIYRSRLL